MKAKGYAWLLGSFACALTACGPGRPAGLSTTKDVATDAVTNGKSSRTYVYYRDGSTIKRDLCPADTPIPDRAHCIGQETQSVPATKFYEGLSSGVGVTLGTDEQTVHELVAKVALDDEELLVLLSTEPAAQPALQAVKDQLAALEIQVGALQVNLDDLNQQIVQIQASLAANLDPDLSAQLAALLTQRTQLIAQMDGLRGQEQAKREDVIKANSSILDAATFNDMQAQRSTDLQRLGKAQAKVAAAMDDVANLNKTIGHLADPTFTIEVMTGEPAFGSLYAFAQRFGRVFASILNGISEFSIADDQVSMTKDGAYYCEGSCTVPRVISDAQAIAVSKTYSCYLDGTQLHCLDQGHEILPAYRPSIPRATHLISSRVFEPSGGPTGPYRDPDQGGVGEGYMFVCAWDDNNAGCWATFYAQDGNQVVEQDVLKPSPMPITKGIAKMVAGKDYFCALAQGAVTCWGDDATVRNAPALTNVTDLAGGAYHVCAVADGRVVCWGHNDHGETGVPSLNQPTAVAAGDDFSCAITADGVECWGANDRGQLNLPDLQEPQEIAGGNSGFACALTDPGVVCWGKKSGLLTFSTPAKP